MLFLSKVWPLDKGTATTVTIAQLVTLFSTSHRFGSVSEDSLGTVGSARRAPYLYCMYIHRANHRYGAEGSEPCLHSATAGRLEGAAVQEISVPVFPSAPHT